MPHRSPPRRTLPITLATLLLAAGVAGPATLGAADDGGLDSHLPDLRILSLRIHPENPRAGQEFYFEAIIENAGNVSTGAFSIHLEHEDGTRTMYPVADFAAGERRNTSSGFRAHLGENTVSVKLDPHREVNESDEHNNFRSMSFFARGPAPDLVVESVTLPEFPVVGERLRFEAVVRNRGNATAYEFSVDFVAANTWIGGGTVHGLEPNETARVASGLWNASQPGEHWLEVRADPYDRVREHVEWNNYAWRSFQVELPPDLAVRILDVERPGVRTDVASVPNPLGVRTLLVEVCNVGDGPMPRGDLHLDVSTPRTPLAPASREAVASVNLTHMAPGRCDVHEFAWDPTGYVGDVRFEARVSSAATDFAWWNDRAEYDDFVLVGGLGGARLPLP